MGKRQVGEAGKHHRELKGPESERGWTDTWVEAWKFWPHEPALRCQWPTSAVVYRLFEDGCLEQIPTPQRYAVQAVLQCYLHLIAHSLGTEEAVQRLRALRRAERGDQ